jgi:DNA repair exonuclease SbcCD ATPase subunit
MQKALLSSDIKRFRCYLGAQYQSKGNIYTDDNKKERARPIYCIFFLGHALGNNEAPVLTVTNQVKDRATGEELQLRHDFIDCLHHKSWIVQISKLKEHRRNDLEKLLSIFDQNNITNSNHILNVNEDDFPEEFKHIICRLKQAAESKEVAEQMTAEDELISDFQSLERKVGAMSEIIEENAKTIEEKDKALEEKDKALEEKGKALEKNKKALEEKDKALEELKKQVAELQKKR